MAMIIIPKYIYRFFNGAAPKDIERKWNQMGRREQYLDERDFQKKLIYFTEEKDLIKKGYSMAQLQDNAASIPEIFEEKEISEQLHQALETLKLQNPRGHDIICRYFYNYPETTLEEIGKIHGISKQRTGKILNDMLKKLRDIINSMEN